MHKIVKKGPSKSFPLDKGSAKCPSKDPAERISPGALQVSTRSSVKNLHRIMQGPLGRISPERLKILLMNTCTGSSKDHHGPPAYLSEELLMRTCKRSCKGFLKDFIRIFATSSKGLCFMHWHCILRPLRLHHEKIAGSS